MGLFDNEETFIKAEKQRALAQPADNKWLRLSKAIGIGQARWDNPKADKAKAIKRIISEGDMTTPKGWMGIASKLKESGYNEESLTAQQKAQKSILAKAQLDKANYRKPIKKEMYTAADGYKYWSDDPEKRVNPNAKLPPDKANSGSNPMSNSRYDLEKGHMVTDYFNKNGALLYTKDSRKKPDIKEDNGINSSTRGAITAIIKGDTNAYNKVYGERSKDVSALRKANAKGKRIAKLLNNIDTDILSNVRQAIRRGVQAVSELPKEQQVIASKVREADKLMGQISVALLKPNFGSNTSNMELKENKGNYAQLVDDPLSRKNLLESINYDTNNAIQELSILGDYGKKGLMNSSTLIPRGSSDKEKTYNDVIDLYRQSVGEFIPTSEKLKASDKPKLTNESLLNAIDNL